MQDGILAGGMADGSIGLWNPGRIARAHANGGAEEGTPVATMRTHKGAVRAEAPQSVEGCHARLRLVQTGRRSAAPCTGTPECGM